MRLKPGCMGVPPRLVRGPCAAGIDIRPGSWDVVVADLVRNPSTHVSVVRPVFVGKVDDEEQVMWVLRQWKVRYAVADTRPETTLAKRLQEKAFDHGIKVWRAEYNTAPSGSSVEITENANEGLLKLDRTMTLDNVHFSFLTGRTVLLPQNYRSITGGDFVREMCSSSRVPVKVANREAWSWEHQGPDHAFHAWNYLLVAIQKSNLLAYGGALTMGAHKGIVEGTLRRNITADPIETGVKTAGTVAARGGIDWKGILDEEDGGGLYLEV